MMFLWNFLICDPYSKEDEEGSDILTHWPALFQELERVDKFFLFQTWNFNKQNILIFPFLKFS